MITNKYTPNDIVFGRTETEIEKTITRALNKIGVPVDYSKISSLGWKPKYKLREGLENAYSWFKENYE